MKNIYLLLFLIPCVQLCIAQGVFTNQTNNALEKVVKDYPSQFKNIKGELVSSSGSTTEYKSTISIPGAVSTSIVQTGSEQKQSVSWHSVVCTAKDFATASRRFEETFNQIKNTVIKPAGANAVIVNGVYMDPSPEKTFSAIQFDLMPSNRLMQNVSIDLVLTNTGKQWEIILNVYDKDLRDPEVLTAR